MTPTQKKCALDRFRRSLELRRLRPNTVATYGWRARQFLERVGKAPRSVTRNDVENYLLGLQEAGRSASTCNLTLAAIRYLLRANTRKDVTTTIPLAKCPRRQVCVLSGSDVERVFAHTKSTKYRAIFMLAYGAGLRVGEIRHLCVEDIHSGRGLIRIRDGKTGERYAPLGGRVLGALRAYYKEHRPPGPELFPGRSPRGKSGSVLTRNAISKVLKKVVKEAGIDKRATPHTFRHSYATHLLDTGTDIRTVQVLLGHANIESTTKYLHVSRKHIANVPSPLDLLGTPRGRTLG
jgi:site-specific recombinase XerD